MVERERGGSGLGCGVWGRARDARGEGGAVGVSKIQCDIFSTRRGDVKQPVRRSLPFSRGPLRKFL